LKLNTSDVMELASAYASRLFGAIPFQQRACSENKVWIRPLNAYTSLSVVSGLDRVWWPISSPLVVPIQPSQGATHTPSLLPLQITTSMLQSLLQQPNSIPTQLFAKLACKVCHIEHHHCSGLRANQGSPSRENPLSFSQHFRCGLAFPHHKKGRLFAGAASSIAGSRCHSNESPSEPVARSKLPWADCLNFTTSMQRLLSTALQHSPCQILR
jgi:hypothetical protein